MEAFIELSTQFTLLTQPLKKRQKAYGRHQRVAGQVSHLNMLLREVQYVGNSYKKTYDSGWPHHAYLSWETNENISQLPQEKESNLERAMAELVENQVEFANSQVQFMHETRAHLEIYSTQKLGGAIREKH